MLIEEIVEDGHVEDIQEEANKAPCNYLIKHAMNLLDTATRPNIATPLGRRDCD